MRRALLLGLLLFLSACQSTPPPAWLTLAHAEQGRAPAMLAHADRVTAVWVGGDSVGLHHDARQWIDHPAELHGSDLLRLDDDLMPITVLPLPPTAPYDQHLYPAADGGLHLLWLDQDADGQPTLYGALLTPDLIVQRTAPISDRIALRYAAAPDGDGGLWAAWSGGLLSEPTLYVRHIDREGRPLDQFHIAANAEYPAMIRMNSGDLYLFWIANGQVIRARLINGQGQDAAPITSAVSLAAGDRLHDFSAALDSTHGYLFWNITRADGANETWMASGTLDAPYWNAPARLQLELRIGRTVEPSESALTWVSPLIREADVLAVAAQFPSGLGVVSLRGGAIVGWRQVVPDIRLIGAPALTAREDGSLVLAWASPDDLRAALNVIGVE